MNEQVKFIEDSMKPGFKQSAAAIKLEVSKACVNGILKREEKNLTNVSILLLRKFVTLDLVNPRDLVNFFPLPKKFTK